VKSLNAVQCSECRQTIDSKADVSFVRFRVPGTGDYHYFHWRIRGGDCWETYLNTRILANSGGD
jgi:hypothetical protein